MTPNSRSLYPFLTFLVVAATALAQSKNGDVPFEGNRRPGILEEASEVPTGENAHRYQEMGEVAPDELLDLLSEKSETAELKIESSVTPVDLSDVD